jgi:hypothetical protein
MASCVSRVHSFARILLPGWKEVGPDALIGVPSRDPGAFPPGFAGVQLAERSEVSQDVGAVEPELGREKPRDVDEHLGVIEEERLAHGLQVVISLVATVDQRGVALPLRTSLSPLLTSHFSLPTRPSQPAPSQISNLKSQILQPAEGSGLLGESQLSLRTECACQPSDHALSDQALPTSHFRPASPNPAFSLLTSHFSLPNPPNLKFQISNFKSSPLTSHFPPTPSPRTISPVETTKIHVPHPSIVAAREALAKNSPAPLSRILDQIKKAEAWRTNHPSGNGSKKKGT